MTAYAQNYTEAIKKASQALNLGKRGEARRWAQVAAKLSPESEEPWLILAAVSSPEASVEYLNQALTINPQSKKAKAGMEWARSRVSGKPEKQEIQPGPQKERLDPKITSKSFIRFQSSPLIWGFLLIIALGVFSIWNNRFISLPKLSEPETVPVSENQFDKVTRTPTFTPTFTNTPLPTATSTFTETPQPTATLAPSETPTRSAAAIKKNKAKKTATARAKAAKKSKVVVAPASVSRPSKVGKNQRWIDIDLSSQRAYAYVGDTLTKGFVVSTGTWQHPTVTGVFAVYVKYRAADMSGPGYYLPDVPYVMYFYQDYGLHGTYWHNNFGTPMSHGCVNFSTSDAAWLYNFASIGTIVNIHR